MQSHVENKENIQQNRNNIKTINKIISGVRAIQNKPEIQLVESRSYTLFYRALKKIIENRYHDFDLQYDDQSKPFRVYSSKDQANIISDFKEIRLSLETAIPSLSYSASQKISFLMGLHRNAGSESAVSILRNNKIADAKNLPGLILSYLFKEPKKEKQPAVDRKPRQKKTVDSSIR